MKHYEKSELDMYLNKEMSPPARLACSQHLTTCQPCAKLLDELESDFVFVEQLKTSVNTFKEAAKVKKPRMI